MLKKKDLKRIGRLFGKIDVQFTTENVTSFNVICNLKWIYINLDELAIQTLKEKARRGHLVKDFSLMVLLHEIGHYKFFQKCNNNPHKYNLLYSKEYREKVADRYARRSYPKVLKTYKKYLTK